MTVTPTETGPLGPGTLTIGETGTEIDVSCLINNAVLAMTKDQGDNVTKLCGTVVPGAITYSYELSGNIDTDVGTDAGLFALSQSAAGTQVPFTFVPNTELGTEAAGTIILDPLDFGGDTTGETMTSDFTFALVGKPTYTYAAETPLADDTAPELVDA